jgi:hypothetical protein
MSKAKKPQRKGTRLIRNNAQETIYIYGLVRSSLEIYQFSNNRLKKQAHFTNELIQRYF